jgi:UDP-glucose 4-epimerase
MKPDLTIVTGGAGFIGSELVRQLLDRGDDVVVVDNFVNGRPENLEGLPSDRLEVIREDIRRLDTLVPWLARATTVYHLACLGVRHSVHCPDENHEVNATATLHLLRACRAQGVGKFVCVSSSEVYGTARWAPMDENHPTSPCTVYGGSKLAAESYARAYHRTYGYPTVVVRPFNTYGPRSHHEGDSGEVIPKFLLRSLAGRPLVVFGDGTQTRDFTYVSDSARGIILAGTADAAVGRTINLGSGVETTVNELAVAVTAATGRERPDITREASRPGDVLRLCADMTLARTLLGYEVGVALGEGLSRLLTWYREQGQTPEELLAGEVVRNWERQIAPAHVREGTDS